MKYANLYWQSTELNDSGFRAVNIGDNLQFLTIEYLYQCMGINKKDICRLKMNELRTYSGEHLVLPMNWALFDKNYMVEDKIAISDNIEPVFLAMTIQSISYKEEYFNEYNINYLKRYEPIGCRDIVTKDVLRGYGIEAYVSGCLTSVFPKRSKNSGQSRILLIDVPFETYQYIPKEIRDNAITMTQQYYYSNSISIEQIIDNVIKQYTYYKDNAKLVVTSRLHVASPCMAMGIPVVFTKNCIDARFSWLDTYLTLYDLNHYNEIDWNPVTIEYESNKQLIIDLAIKRIKGSICKNDEELKKIENLYKVKKYNFRDFKDTIYSNFEKAKNFLKTEYSNKSNFNYGIWGIGQAAENFYMYMQQNYPFANLVTAIDAYKKVEFHGIKTINPELYVRKDNEIIFVLPVQASNIAPKILMEKGFSENEFVCAGDQFIHTNDLTFNLE